MAVPSRVPAPDAVAALVYYSRVAQAGAPTHFAPLSGPSRRMHGSGLSGTLATVSSFFPWFCVSYVGAVGA